MISTMSGSSRWAARSASSNSSMARKRRWAGGVRMVDGKEGQQVGGGLVGLGTVGRDGDQHLALGGDRLVVAVVGLELRHVLSDEKSAHAIAGKICQGVDKEEQAAQGRELV